jgi:hypothetical protein
MPVPSPRLASAGPQDGILTAASAVSSLRAYHALLYRERSTNEEEEEENLRSCVVHVANYPTSITPVAAPAVPWEDDDAVADPGGG